MAKKPPPPPSTSASSSEEDESSSDEEQPPGTSKPEPRTPAKGEDDENEEEEESEDESEKESDDDDDDEERGSDSKKPQPSALSGPEPASGSESGEDGSDSEEAKLVTPISSRPMANSPSLKASDSEKPNGKPLFQRIWTPDDEIAILKAMADFEAEHGPIRMSPSAIGDFLGFVKDSLSIGVSGTQLVDKIRRLKKKYAVVSARANDKRKGLKSATAHDQAVFELGKKVWGKEEGDDYPETVGNGKVSDAVASTAGKRGYPLLKEAVAEIGKKTGSCLVAEALVTIDSEKASVLENKLKKQKLAEIKHSMHELDLLKETLKLIMEGAERAVD